MKKTLFVMTFLAAPALHAATLACSEDANTKALTCFDAKAVRANGAMRATAMYQGGPGGVDKTGYTAVVNCEAGYLELRDRKGVVFARDQPSKLHTVRFRDAICDVKTPKLDKTLSK